MNVKEVGNIVRIGDRIDTTVTNRMGRLADGVVRIVLVRIRRDRIHV